MTSPYDSYRYSDQQNAQHRLAVSGAVQVVSVGKVCPQPELLHVQVSVASCVTVGVCSGSFAFAFSHKLLVQLSDPICQPKLESDKVFLYRLTQIVQLFT